ncbi:iron complex transport system ATP-binding protein [Maritalea mobilis]|uniref:Iron complex transport system ATP-binding protein n=1 Tax=Maritalea mobilis TaxID=483324 RepID=A0A4R6VWE2_9HYPH|nr:ABC transporter ATP-binding protein [Maritalea mobilis]TDQ67137.1 iron complex transport system ATP-binding protein [Maritalea mobilis]
MLHKASPKSSNTIFKLEQVGFEIGDKHLVKSCSFEVHQGHFVGLLGPNGAGKSSLLKLLYREKKPTTGTITAFDRSIDSWNRRAFAAKVGTVLQEKAQLAGLTIEQVASLGLFPLACSKKEEHQRVQHALELVELWDRRSENAGYLSGGEQQRLFFAQILALDPEVYLLDEPNNHLDIYFQIRLLDHIKAKGKTVIASFHDINLAARYCDQAVLMHQSEMVSQGPLEEVLSPERLKEIYRVNAQFNNSAITIHTPVGIDAVR